MWTSLIPLPYRWAAILLLCAALGGFCWVNGAQHEAHERDAQDAIHKRQDADQRANDTEHARQQEQLLRATLDAQATERAKENADHAKELDTLRAAARAGTERLRCPAAALPADTQAANPGAASRPEPEAGRDSIVPGAADNLFSIGSRITRLVRERNALIDAYNEARATCNAP